MRSLVPMLILLLVALSAAPAEAQRPADRRRAELAAQVHERFVAEAAERMRLDARGQARLADVLREYGERRQALAEEGLRLRRSLVAAVQSSATPDSTFRRALAQFDQLRMRELRLWREEQEALARVLTPRQQAEFAMLRARFAERISRVRAGGPGGPPQRRPPGPE